MHLTNLSGIDVETNPNMPKDEIWQKDRFGNVVARYKLKNGRIVKIANTVESYGVNEEATEVCN